MAKIVDLPVLTIHILDESLDLGRPAAFNDPRLDDAICSK
ncbi:hypothetical protein HNO88_004190 [Novosphingobium chloroacetimidivorans]|uniref:Uncharacterized protein n=1 Tax=Novosphingobium chloroacetimidivorans TaxID=1428314 RepID=A0A7W7KDI7_9SPHN|nr:hypothetical protein [Novosphingobium chloroacetimidivorans]